MRQRILQDSEGILRLTPTEGPPVSGTLTVLDPDGEVVFEDQAIDLAIDTSLDGAVSSGDLVITFTTITGATVGKEFWLGTMVSTPIEMLRVRSVDADVVTLTRPLTLDHADDEEILGAEITYTLDVGNTAVLGRGYTAIWTYTTSDSALHTVSALFDVVERVFTLPVTSNELRIRIADSMLDTITEAFQLTELLEAAQDDIETDLLRAGMYADEITDPAAFRRLGVIACRRILLRRVIDADPVAVTSLDRAEQEYYAELAQLLNNTTPWRATA